MRIGKCFSLEHDGEGKSRSFLPNTTLFFITSHKVLQNETLSYPLPKAVISFKSLKEIEKLTRTFLSNAEWVVGSTVALIEANDWQGVVRAIEGVNFAMPFYNQVYNCKPSSTAKEMKSQLE